MIAQTSQGDGTSTTSSVPIPEIEPNTSHAHTNPHTGHNDPKPRITHTKTKNNGQEDTSQYTFNQSHRNIITITKYDHDGKGTLQPDISPQKPVPTPNKVQETGKECIARPSTETVERIDSSGVSSENDNNQPKTPAEHHTILTPQQKNKQKMPTSSRHTHET